MLVLGHVGEEVVDDLSEFEISENVWEWIETKNPNLTVEVPHDPVDGRVGGINVNGVVDSKLNPIASVLHLHDFLVSVGQGEMTKEVHTRHPPVINSCENQRQLRKISVVSQCSPVCGKASQQPPASGEGDEVRANSVARCHEKQLHEITVTDGFLGVEEQEPEEHHKHP